MESLFPNIPLQGTTHFWVEDLFSLRKKCLYSELFWSVFSHIWTNIQSKYGEIQTRITTNTNIFYAVLG